MSIDSVNEAAVAAAYMSGWRPQRARREVRALASRGRRQRRSLDAAHGVETATVAASEAAAPTSTAAVARDTLESYVVLDAGVSAEWSGSEGGPPAEVELRLHPERTPHATTPDPPPHIRRRAHLTDFNLTQADGGDDTNSTGGSGGPGSGGSGGGAVVVRAEEALIVAFVLLLWVAAIALFFNRWGKIRMLEPYQPKFQQQQHRASCPADSIGPGVGVTPALSSHHRASLSRGCGSCGDYAFGGSGPTFQQCSSYQPPPCPAAAAAAAVYLAHRPRQNSVFVGSTGAMALIPESPARRSRSAADLRALLHPPPARRPPAVSPRASVSSAHYLTVTDV